MGVSSSKHAESGILQGAYAPPIQGVTVPSPLEGGKDYEVIIPSDKKAGETFIHDIGRGHMASITVPKDKKGGFKMIYRYRGEIEKVVASTLNSIPGFVVVQSKPVIWAIASYDYFKNLQPANTSMAKSIAGLMQEAQEGLLSKAIDLGCNAVLGMTINITVDSSGPDGNSKTVIVTLCGTPCSVAPSKDLPGVNADDIVEPLYLNNGL